MLSVLENDHDRVKYLKCLVLNNATWGVSEDNYLTPSSRFRAQIPREPISESQDLAGVFDVHRLCVCIDPAEGVGDRLRGR